MRKIDLAVIHCTATKEGVSYNVARIREMHIARGFKDIGYHFLIHLDGTVETGRPFEEAGAHAKGYNAHSVGISYVGGLDAYGKAKDTRTPEQVTALRSVVSTLKGIYPDIKVVGHRDLSVDLNGDGVVSKNEWMKECPSFSVSSNL